MSTEPEVGYTVKELIKGLSDRIDGFMALLASKADQASMAHALDRIDSLHNRVTQIEHAQQAETKHSSAKQEFKRWAIPVLLSAVTIAVLIIQTYRPWA